VAAHHALDAARPAAIYLLFDLRLQPLSCPSLGEFGVGDSLGAGEDVLLSGFGFFRGASSGRLACSRASATCIPARLSSSSFFDSGASCAFFRRSFAQFMCWKAVKIIEVSKVKIGPPPERF
jgi:hypothetical protein